MGLKREVATKQFKEGLRLFAITIRDVFREPLLHSIDCHKSGDDLLILPSAIAYSLSVYTMSIDSGLAIGALYGGSLWMVAGSASLLLRRQQMSA